MPIAFICVFPVGSVSHFTRYWLRIHRNASYRKFVASPTASLSQINQEIERVELALLSSLQADDPYLTELATHLAKAGGKRLRPVMAIAAGSCGLGPGVNGELAPVSDEIILGGVSVELVHLGSLYHDDVMDEAETRRGVESVNARWGNLRAILAGDFLLAKASEIAASLGTEVAGLLASTIGSLCEGQVRELQTTFNSKRTEDEYFASIAGKTASLFASACRIGAIVAELPRDQIEALTLFGNRYGMAFQIIDDILDVVATDEQLGKPAGNDLAEGIYTLPILGALQAEVEGPQLAALLGGPLGRDDVAVARNLVRATSGVNDALVVARAYCDEAVGAVASFKPGPAVDHLRSLASGLLNAIP